MPEYLAPGVYVEEVDTGSKPIEGVSTSTAGVVGVTERGPLNVPVLVTSVGDYWRKFGGRLDFLDFTVNNVCHAYLPYAIEGFFRNLGKRVYVTRVAPENSALAALSLFQAGTAGSAESLLLTGAAEGSGTTTPVYVADNTGINPGDTVRIGDGSRAEYRQVAATHDRSITVAHVFAAEHGTGDVRIFDRGVNIEAHAPISGFTVSVVTATDQITVTGNSAELDKLATLGAPGPSPNSDVLLEVGRDSSAEYRRTTAIAQPGGAGADVELTLDRDLASLPNSGDVITILQYPGDHGDGNAPVEGVVATTTASLAGDSELSVDPGAASIAEFFDVTGTRLLEIDSGGADLEIRRIQVRSRLNLNIPCYATYPQHSEIKAVSLADDDRNIDAVNSDTSFDVDNVDALVTGMNVTINGTDAIIASAGDPLNLNRVTLAEPGVAGVADSDSLEIAAISLSGDAPAGSVSIVLDNRLGLQSGHILGIGAGQDLEYAVISEVLGSRGVAPDAGEVVLTSPLQRSHPSASTTIRRQLAPAPIAGRFPAALELAAAQDAVSLLSRDGVGFQQDDVVEVTTPTGVAFYHVLSAGADPLASIEVELDTDLLLSHDAGEAFLEVSSIANIRALDPGAWGDRLRISVSEEETGLAHNASVESIDRLANRMRLLSVSGIETGSVLELYNRHTGEQIGPLLKVSEVEPNANNRISFEGVDLDAELPAAADLPAEMVVRSRELSLTVRLLQRTDPAVPSRNDRVQDSEAFNYLSMDPRHSRYIETVIGTFWNPGSDTDANGTPLRKWDRRSEGESLYIRIEDTAADEAAEHSVRVGPEALVDTLADGRTRAARLALTGGSDAVGNMTDAMYEGVNNAEPENRTGIHSFSNIEQISLVACPGQNSSSVQQALINHCEALRYRFAVLDGRAPRNDTITDVMAQRQQFDTKYAALYHPWLMIPDPMPDNLSSIRQVPIPPSGHMLGVYARTDVERGVHKAPANETVRGIIGLARTLNKAEHDILNPYPVNINVIRDFRPDNRGIRVWGARCITSDPDYKYVNVRRLMIFLEHSIDRGLQWVVFEPNAEPLWARVRRSIANFLTVVWRNGALEGTSAEEAFFVKCDRETMTQTDIENGRLICQVGVSPVKPAEYAIIKIGLWTAHGDEN